MTNDLPDEWQWQITPHPDMTIHTLIITLVKRLLQEELITHEEALEYLVYEIDGVWYDMRKKLDNDENV